MIYIWAWQPRHCTRHAAPLPEWRRPLKEEARAVELFGDEGGEITGIAQGFDEFGRISHRAIKLAPVLAGKLGAEFPDLLADILIIWNR